LFIDLARIQRADNKLMASSHTGVFRRARSVGTVRLSPAMTTSPSPAMTATLPAAVDSSSLYLRCLMRSLALFSLGRVIA
jgi:hypothetical protein